MEPAAATGALAANEALVEVAESGEESVEAGTAWGSCEKALPGGARTSSTDANRKETLRMRLAEVERQIRPRKTNVEPALNPVAPAPHRPTGFVRKTISQIARQRKRKTRTPPNPRKPPYRPKLRVPAAVDSLFSQSRMLTLILTRKEAWAKPGRRCFAGGPSPLLRCLVRSVPPGWQRNPNCSRSHSFPELHAIPQTVPLPRPCQIERHNFLSTAIFGTAILHQSV